VVDLGNRRKQTVTKPQRNGTPPPTQRLRGAWSIRRPLLVQSLMQIIAMSHRQSTDGASTAVNPPAASKRVSDCGRRAGYRVIRTAAIPLTDPLADSASQNFA